MLPKVIIKLITHCRVRWGIPAIPALERQRQVDFRVQSQPGLQKTCLKKKKKEKEKEKKKKTKEERKKCNMGQERWLRV